MISFINRFPLHDVSTMHGRVWHVPTVVSMRCFHKSGFSNFSFKCALHDLVKLWGIILILFPPVMFGSFVDQYRGNSFCRPYSCIWVDLAILYCGCCSDVFSLDFHFYYQCNRAVEFYWKSFIN